MRIEQVTANTDVEIVATDDRENMAFVAPDQRIEYAPRNVSIWAQFIKILK